MSWLADPVRLGHELPLALQLDFYCGEALVGLGLAIQLEEVAEAGDWLLVYLQHDVPRFEAGSLREFWAGHAEAAGAQDAVGDRRLDLKIDSLVPGEHRPNG